MAESPTGQLQSVPSRTASPLELNANRPGWLLPAAEQPLGVCLCIQASVYSARSSQGVVLVPSLKQREGGTDGM